MDLTLYQKMIGINNRNVTDAYINDTIIHVNDMFDKSPSFRNVVIDDNNMDCIIYRKEDREIEILLRPLTVIKKGTYASLNGDTYMLTEFIENEIYPKGKIELCNSVLKWKDESGEIHEFKCIVKGDTFKKDDPINQNNKLIISSDSEIKILVQYNDETATIRPNQRFIFGNGAYEVVSIDGISEVYNGTGILKLIVKYSNLTETDDKENQIADDSGNSGWGEW